MGQPFTPDKVPPNKGPRRASFFTRAKIAIRLFYQKAMTDKLFDRAANVAFQALFSLIPILALAYVIFALSGGYQDLQQAVENWAVQNFAPSIGDQVIEYLRTIQTKVDPKTIGIFGILGFLWAGVSMISTAENAMNGLWGLTRTRGFFRRLWLYSVAVILAPIALGGSLAATSFLGAQTAGNETLRTAFIIPLALVPFAITGTFFSFVYWLLPYTTVSKKAAAKAGFITGAVFEVLKQGYTIYATHTMGHSIYGSLAALPILFLWISLSATVFMLGAELCYFLDMREQGVAHVAKEESHLSFPLLVDILRLYQKTDGPLSVKKVVHELDWDQSDVFRHVHYLVDVGLIKSPEGFSEGDECYQAVELNFEAGVEKIIRGTNTISYLSRSFAQSGPSSSRLSSASSTV